MSVCSQLLATGRGQLTLVSWKDGAPSLMKAVALSKKGGEGVCIMTICLFLQPRPIDRFFVSACFTFLDEHPLHFAHGPKPGMQCTYRIVEKTLDNKKGYFGDVKQGSIFLCFFLAYEQ